MSRKGFHPDFRVAVMSFYILLLAGALLLSSGHAQDAPPRKTALSEDTSIGKVVDREGMACIKPVMYDRWATAEENLPLETGDWLKTGKRGANALYVRLSSGATLILGPGTLVELVDPKSLKLLRGECEVAAPKDISVKVIGPKKITVSVTDVKWLRAREDKLTTLDKEPRWLTGYKSNQSTEAMGSLLANVEGRNVPLTIGYHKVTVDIRDQIARTMIEESFVNHTRHVLEGIFYFPLPQDASISGFAMWIGDEMVEADIVEKQRAREIYETILREKRDPGLLEWTGGNIFKARIYPIWAHAEKRIRITYTQVLPKTGGVYRYNYSLQSEMLRLHPLRQLQIEVKLNSAEPLLGIECPSHTCRIDTTKHSAHVEFDAEEYTPTRDFELRIATGMPENNIAMIPHRRGRDGYLMLLVNAPEQKDKPTRPTLTNTGPLNLIVMADTSGSMSGPQRDTQLAFIEALLGSLGESDTFNIMTCDTQARWMSRKPLVTTESNRESALRYIEKRYPLGWSDLDQAFKSVIESLTAGTHVVYVGDGVVTTGDADPVAFGKRLQRMYRGAGTFHAVAPGSSYESVVLGTIAGLGGGSTREVGGGTDPAQTAFALLKEISSPVVRDLEVTFSGVSVAAVYPETLPNLPAGTQQIIIGRYDPTHGDQKACVTVSGTLEGKKIEYTKEVTLAGAETGNSFIPRLWARKHLDHLLAQGRTPQIKNRIIALSEDFQIMTPYTSFLVLESDEDRKRFNVKRRFRMRDAEEFFAEGRDRADYELTRKQMLKAKRWRLQLRAEILDALAGMSRDMTGLLLPYGRPPADFLGAPVSGAVPRGVSFDHLSNKNLESTSVIDAYGIGGGRAGAYGPRRGKSALRADYLQPSGEEGGIPAPMEEAATAPPEFFAEDEFDEEPAADEEKAEKEMVFKKEAVEITRGIPRGRKFDHLKDKKKRFLQTTSEISRLVDREPRDVGKWSWDFDNTSKRYYHDPFTSLFPQVPAPPVERPESDWPEEILNLVKHLNRRQVVAKSDQALRILVRSRYKDHRGRVTSRSRGEYLLSKGMWLTVSPHVSGMDFSYNWCAGGERGILTAAWLLGRVRDKREGDENAWHAPFSWYFGNTIKGYASYTAEMKKLDDGKVELTLRHPTSQKAAVVLIIDSEKAAVIEYRYYNIREGKVTFSQVYSNFVKVADAWWPKLITTKNKDGKVTGTTRVTIESLLKERLALTVTGILSVRRKNAIVLAKEPESVPAAKQAVKDGVASFEDHYLLLRYFGASQQWDKAQPHMQAIRRKARNRWGFNRIKMAYLQASRRNEELKTLLMRLTARLAKVFRRADYACAQTLISYTRYLNQGNERMELIKKLKPVYGRRKLILNPLLPWDRQVFYCLQNMGRRDEAFAKTREMAKKYPFNSSMQTSYASQLAARGEVDAAIAYLAQVEKDNGPWLEHEIQSFRSTCASILLNAYRLEDFVEYIEAWGGEKIEKRELPEKVPEYNLNQYLSALIMLDREAKAWKLIEDWLTSTRKEELEAADRNRLGAAIAHALGRGYNMYRYRYEVRDARLLAETARYFADHETQHHFAGRILQDYNFYRTDECSRVKLELYERLKAETMTMPVQKIGRFFQWLKSGNFKTDEGEEGWQKILDKVYSKWEKEEDDKARQVLVRLILNYGRRKLKLKYYRKLLTEAQTPAEKVAAAGQLFNALLAGEWSQAVQDEILGLLQTIAREVGDDEKAADAAFCYMDRAIVGFYRLTSWLPRARARIAVNALPDVNEMPRRKLRAAWRKALKEARGKAVELLGELEKNFRPQEVRPWIAMERIYLQVLLGSDMQKIRRDTMALLRPVLASSAGKEADDIKARDTVLAVRCVATLTYLCSVEPDAEDAISELMTVMDKGLAQGNQALDWKVAKYMLLMALDRGDDLEAALKVWYGEEGKFAKIHWGRDYAYILAERNDINEAVKVFEEIERIDELSYRDYRTLADWYMVQDAKEKHREVKIKSWQTLREYDISNAISRESYKYQRRGPDVPSELDAEIPLMFIALLRKAQNPGSHLHLLRNFYRTTKDFRLLECVGEAVIGQSSQKIYPVMAQFTYVTNLIMDEATLDRLEKHLVGLHERAKTDVDRRGLRLLEFMVEHRATTQSHGTGPHADAALRALTQACKGEWAYGERELMAAFLANQGRMAPEALAREQLRQLSALHAGAEHGSYPRFVIAGHYARTQWAHNRRDEAIRTLTGAINEFRTSQGGLLGQSANNLLNTCCSYLQSVGDFAAAEKVWLGELGLGHNTQQILYLKQQLYRHYHSALSGRGDVSLGSGTQLYQAVRDLIIKDLLSRTNEGHARTVATILCDIWYTCYRKLRYTTVRQDITGFAFEILPEVLAIYNYRNGQSVVSTVARRLHDIAGPLTALEFLVARAETEPRWLRLANQDFWSHNGHFLAQLRHNAGALSPKLEARVLSIVLRELREDLRTRRGRNQNIYHNNYRYFWSQKKDDFARTAHEVLAPHSDSEQTVIYIARYFYHGLDLYRDAIDALYAAYRKGILGIDGRHQLCKYLQEQKRYDESVPLLVKLIEEKPGRLEFRTMLMRAYFHTGQERELRETLTAADAYFHEAGLWQEVNVAGLGAACLETKLFQECAGYYKEAIALHVKRALRRGVGDGVLSRYYEHMAGAYSGLGLTAEAVDAAAGAIIAWGSSVRNRRYALNRLENVLRQAADIDEYVRKLDADVAETGLENPIVRKALGKVYFEKRQFKKAQTQLRLAIENQPNDLETHRLLVRVYDSQHKPKQATRQLLESAKLSGHDIRLYRDLGDRLVRMDRTEEAERAYTNIVEMLPNESESHASLAVVWQNQGRWKNAEVQWRQVIRVRTKEPAGYLGLARALLKMHKWDEALEVTKHLLRTDWPARFGDVHSQARQIERQLK